MCEIRENAMQKKQFQQNMKDKVRVFEDGGIRLLKRGQKGVVHAIFSRFGLVLVLLLFYRRSRCSACCSGSVSCCRIILAAPCW